MALMSSTVIIASLAFLTMVAVVGWLAWGSRKKYVDEQRAANDPMPPDAAPDAAPDATPPTPTED